MIRDSLAGILHYLKISTLFVLCKLRCKYVFDNVVSSFISFCQLKREEVCMHLMDKASVLIRDAKLLDYVAYSDSIAVLVTLNKLM